MAKSRHVSFAMRPMESSDLAVVSEWFLDLDDLSRFDRSLRIPENQEAARKSWSGALESHGSEDRHWFSITDDSDRPIGIVGLEHISLLNRDAVVPLFIERQFRRKGVAIRALSLTIDIAFGQLGLGRVTSYLRADNAASRALVERVGFRQEGCIRDAWFSGGQLFDMITVGILQQEWIERRQVLAGELDGRTVVRFGRGHGRNWSWPPEDGTEAEIAGAAHERSRCTGTGGSGARRRATRSLERG